MRNDFKRFYEDRRKIGVDLIDGEQELYDRCVEANWSPEVIEEGQQYFKHFLTRVIRHEI